MKKIRLVGCAKGGDTHVYPTHALNREPAINHHCGSFRRWPNQGQRCSRALAKDGKLNENLENRLHRRAMLLMQREGPNLLPVLKIAHFVYRPVRGSSFAYAP